MDFNKLAPWNWFSKEEEQQSIPVSTSQQRPPQEGSPLTPFWQLHQDIHRAFEQAFSNFHMPSFGGSSWFKPTLDVGASDREYTVSIELPGMEEKDIHLELSGNTLKVRGEKKQESESQEKDFYRVERSYGVFQRTLSLPEDADSEKIAARYSNGVMTITIPKSEKTDKNVKTIPIQRA